MSLDFTEHNKKSSEYYSEDGHPIKCKACGSVDIVEIVIDVIDFYNGMGPPCEIEYKCVTCDCTVGWWTYGRYDISYN